MYSFLIGTADRQQILPARKKRGAAATDVRHITCKYSYTLPSVKEKMLRCTISDIARQTGASDNDIFINRLEFSYWTSDTDTCNILLQCVIIGVGNRDGKTVPHNYRTVRHMVKRSTPKGRRSGTVLLPDCVQAKGATTNPRTLLKHSYFFSLPVANSMVSSFRLV